MCLIWIYHIFACFYNGIIPSLKGSLLVQGWIAETVIILHLIPYVKDKEKSENILI